MSAGYFVKKPIPIAALQWTGGNADEVREFAPEIDYHHATTGSMYIPTREGVMRADRNDWIVRGIKGEVYAIKPDIFEETYDEVGDPHAPRCTCGAANDIGSCGHHPDCPMKAIEG